MQTGENVANWREKLNNKLQSEDRFNTTEPNKYSGYVYDAVWLYALALDKLIKLNQSYIQAQYIYYDSKFLASLWPHFAQTYTANVCKDLQGLCGEIGVRGLQIYGDCMYTRNPCNF